jgi:hypothetical protein
MNREIVLPQPVRVFAAFGATMLAWTQKILPSGTKLTIGAPCTKTFDHQNQVAVSVIDLEPGSFLLLREIGLRELVN